MSRFRFGGFLLLTALLVSACSSSTAEVTGTVRVDGELVEEGAIRFTPADGKSPTSGGVIKGGTYSCKVPVGVQKVWISMPKVVGQKKVYDTPDSPMMPVTAEGLAPRFNERSELELDVKPGSNKKDWDVSRK